MSKKRSKDIVKSAYFTLTVFIFLMLFISSCSSQKSNSESNSITGYAFFHQGGETIYDVVKQASLPETRSTFVFVLGDNPQYSQQINEEISNLAPLAEKVGAAKVVSADEQIIDKDLLVVGTPQTNSLSAKFLPADLVLKQGQALIYLDNSDGFKLFVAGATPQDTAVVVDLLLNFEQNKGLLSTNKFLLGSQNQDITVTTPATTSRTTFSSESGSASPKAVSSSNAISSDSEFDSQYQSGSEYYNPDSYPDSGNQVYPDSNQVGSNPTNSPTIENPAQNSEIENRQNLAYDGSEKVDSTLNNQASGTSRVILLISSLAVLLVLAVIGFVMYKRKSNSMASSVSSAVSAASSSAVSSNVSSNVSISSKVITSSNTEKLNFFQRLFKKKENLQQDSVQQNSSFGSQQKAQQLAQKRSQTVDSEKTKELQAYVKACSAQGINTDRIKTSLVQAGWPKDVVNDFFMNYKK